MAVEIRRIVFTEQEFQVIAAMYVNCMGKDIGIPPGTVMKVTVVEKSPLVVKLHIHAKDGRQITHVLDDANVVSAMTAFCAEMKIPLSRKSQKTAKFNRDSEFAFDMVIKSNVAG